MRLSNDKTYLLTYHGTIVCETPDGSLIHLTAKAMERGDFSYFDFDNKQAQQITSSPRQLIHLICPETGDYLTASIDNETVSFSKKHAAHWETFRLLSGKEIAYLEELAKTEWCEMHSGFRCYAGELNFGTDFTFHLGRRALDISCDIPGIDGATTGSAPKRLLAFYDKWKIAEFRQWKPLVYFCAFGAERTFEMLRISISSLRLIADYTGEILVMTDKAESELRVYLKDDKLTVKTMSCKSLLEVYCARYRIGDYADISQYQPLLYCDTDVLFDAPLDPILVKVLLARSICAQGELGYLLAYHRSVGAHLLAEDDCIVGNEFGFNTGILGFGDLSIAVESFSIIHNSVMRYWNLIGENLMGFYDQSTANYVLTKFGGIDKRTLLQHVRFGGKRDLQGGIHPRGFIHLWGTTQKLEEMEEIFEGLLASVATTGIYR